MNTNKTIWKGLLSGVFSILFFYSFAQKSENGKTLWTKELNSHKVFIENRGQFSIPDKEGINVLYAYIGGPEKFYFTNKGVVIQLDKFSKKKNLATIAKSMFEEEKEEENEDLKKTTCYLLAEWQNPNPDSKIMTDGCAEGYYTFDTLKFIANGYHKLIYKNIYPKVDIEYYIPADSSGIKYNIIVYPGADINNIKLKYSGNVKEMILNEEGNVNIKTLAGDITEYAPISHFVNESSVLGSHFNLEDQTISFAFSDQIKIEKPICIDPWVAGVVIAGNDIAWNVDYDYNNNLYAYIRAGNSSIYVNKYSTTGALLWSHTVTSSTMYEGDFLVDKTTGLVYIGEGFNGGGAYMYRLATGGTADGWVTQINTTYVEIWDIAFDCNSNSLIAVGGGTQSNLNGGKIDMGTGAINTANFSGFGGICQDIVNHAINNQGNLFVVYAQTICGVAGQIDNRIEKVNTTLNGPVWIQPSGFSPFVESSNHIPPAGAQTSNGFNCMTVNDNFLFYYDGGGMAAYNPATGATLAATSVNVSGTWYTALNQGGIAADDCDNLYIGGPNGNIVYYHFTGSAFNQLGNLNIGWTAADKRVEDIKFDRTSNLLFISGANSVGVVTAPISSSCNLLTDTTYCTGGNAGSVSVTLNTPASNPLVTYIWQDLAGTTVSSTFNSTSLTNTVPGLPIGTYVVMVQLNAPCGPMFLDTVVVSCPSCSCPVTTTPVACFGGNNGTATTTPAGGVAPYTIVWSPAPPVGQGSTTASGLIAGTYNVTVTDGNNCVSNASGTVTQPSALVSTTSFVAVTCYGGSNGTASVSTIGGTPPYTVLWNNSQTDSTATNLIAGTYTVVVTDANSCTTTGTVTVTQPPQLTITASALPAMVCPGASSVLTASGASTYVWSPATYLSATTGTSVTTTPLSTTTYYITGTDVAGCTATTQVTITLNNSPNITITGTSPICEGQSSTLTGNGGTSYVWSTTESTGSITVSPLTSTTYTVIGTDANTCTNTASYTVNVVPTPISNAGPDVVLCNLSTTLQAVPSVGTGYWSAIFGPGNVSFGDPNSPTSSITVGISGSYTLVWTENSGGSCIDADTVILQLTAPPTSTFTMTPTPISCTGDAITVTYTGNGSAMETYIWDFDGGTAIPGTGSGPHSVSWGTINTGPHNVSLTVSLNGCVSPVTIVSITNPTQLTSTISHTDILCHGEPNGTVNLTPAGGTLPYSFTWNNQATTEDLSGVFAGIYTVLVTDANGCTTTNGTTVLEPGEFHISISPTMLICLGQSAYLTISATGGTPGFTYQWSNGEVNASIVVTPTTNTSYSVIATDANGCTATTSLTVYVSPPLVVTLIANTDSICPGEPVMLIPQITGGVGAPYVILDQNSQTVTPPIYVYPASTGYYSVYVEDACGTSDTGMVYIHVMPLPPAGALADSLAGCQPFTVHFNEVYPIDDRTFVWDFGDNENLSLAHNPVHTYTQAGVFTVTLTVTSIHGCKTIMQYTDMITVWPKPNAQFTWYPEFASVIKPIVSFNNMTTNGNNYVWTFGDGDSSSVINPIHRFPDAGSWEVQLIAISNMGCRDTVMYPVVIQEEYTFYAPTAFSPDMDEKNDFFYAIAHGLKETGFYLAVYDRWGEVIWETTKYSEATEQSEKWDGRAKDNEIVPVGTYTWFAKFKDFKGNDHEKAGAVTVVR